MVEVFKTNVKDRDYANRLIDQIQKKFIGYKANFDLADCDNILRVCVKGQIEPDAVIAFLEKFGCIAEVLQDEVKEVTVFG